VDKQEVPARYLRKCGDRPPVPESVAIARFDRRHAAACGATTVKRIGGESHFDGRERHEHRAIVDKRRSRQQRDRVVTWRRTFPAQCAVAGVQSEDALGSVGEEQSRDTVLFFVQDCAANLTFVLVGPTRAAALPIQRNQAIAGIADKNRIFRDQRVGTRLIRAQAIDPFQAQLADIRSRDRSALSRLEARATLVDSPRVRIELRQPWSGLGADGRVGVAAQRSDCEGCENDLAHAPVSVRHCRR